MTVRRSFVNELGNHIKITIEGPSSISENTLTELEATHLRDALNQTLQSEKTTQTSDTKGLSAVLREWAGNYEEGSFDTEAGLMAEAADALDTLQSRLEAAEAERNGWRKIVGDISALVPLSSVLQATGTTGDLIDWIKQQVEGREAAEAKLAEAGKALEPFAKEADRYEPDEADDHLPAFDSSISIGCLRRARSAASTIPNKGDAAP